MRLSAIDSFLSRKAQGLWKTAMVNIEYGEKEKRWLLTGASVNDCILGTSFHGSHKSLLALMRAERAKEKTNEQNK